MESPIPESIFRPLTTNGDQVVMHPPGGEEFCLPIPQTSDYLIPLPSGATVGLIANMDYASATEGSYDSTGAVATISTACSANICTPPAVASPNAPNVEFNLDGAAMGGSDCWETSFILPNSKSDQPLLSGAVGGVGTTNVNDSQRSIHDAVMNGAIAAGNLSSGHTSSSQHSPVLHNGMNGIKMNQLNHNNNNNNNHQHHHQQPHQHVVHEMEEAKLISLDTPQPTPTTIQPPLSFSSQLDGITLDPATLTKSLQQHKVGAGGVGKSVASSSYANVQMMPSSVNATHQLIGADVAIKELPNGGASVGGVEKINGMIDAALQNGPSGVLNGVATVNGNGVAAVNADTTAPFTIQGYNDRYKDKHAEISC